MPRYLVEREFEDGLHMPVRPDQHNADAGVTWLHSYVSEDRRRSYCVCDADSPEAIRRTASRSGLPVERITQVRVLDPYPYLFDDNGGSR
ncbi:MAG TPA: DUF4242 domain-containing protein [Gaiellaceae bacterium]|nr:DUF4242 domain-containing protein [Gaiellaceae bacterium]